MLFITEDDLRYKYRMDPFTEYEQKPDTRLTPGARQFLLDRGINLYEGEKKTGPVIREAITKEICCPSANPEHNAPAQIKPSKYNWRMKQLHAKLDTVHAAFLMTEAAVLKSDIMRAQNLMALSKHFDEIRSMVKGNGNACNFTCKECHGMTCADFRKDMGDCFEITDFHVQLPNSSEILALNQLRCMLREIEPVVMQVPEGNDSALALCTDLIEKIDQLINSVSQMICAAVGGKECQRER